jgi:hypothetical protein
VSREALVRTIPIAVVNASTVVSEDEVLAATAAVQIQVRRDFAPVWNIDADLAVVPAGASPPVGAWWAIILDNSDLGSALGYHDLTSDGQPLAKVFAGTAKQSGEPWTTLLSHEVLEMLADPYIYLTALAPGEFGLLLYPYENCDACQSPKYGYLIGDQLVSDFVYPAWFDPNQTPGSQLDFGKHIQRPFQLLPGGYSLIYDLSLGTGWHLITGADTERAYTMRPRVGSRRERRRSGLTSWLKSRVPTDGDFQRATMIRPTL